MKAQYQTAARYPTAYYGQLARGRLGLREIALDPSRPPADAEGVRSDLVRAADVLYAIGQLDLVLTFVSDLAETNSDVATLKALGELTAHHNDAQAMLILGKTALARGLAMERYAFPEVGVPAYAPIASPIDRCVVYSVVRTESAFDQRDISSAMQLGSCKLPQRPVATPRDGLALLMTGSVSYSIRSITRKWVLPRSARC